MPRVNRGASLVLCLLMLVTRLTERVSAEDAAEYRFENYQEDADRIQVLTQALRLEMGLGSKVTAKGLFVYDAVSGATPTGGPAPAGTNQVPLVEIDDARYAGALEFAIRHGRHVTTPQIAYSQESDYQSVGLSLNHSIEFNEKNTTLNLGLARNFDRVKGSFQPDYQHKETWDLLLGVNQLLGPRTHFTANVSFGYADGYLTDPYKGVYFSFLYPDPALNYFPDTIAEARPAHRFKQILQASVTHFVEKIQGSAEAGLRFYHDDFGILSPTVELAWHQKLGETWVITPSFRYYYQTAADFYGTQFNGDPQFLGGARAAFQGGSFIAYEGDAGFPADPTGYDIVSVPRAASYYSADYRLSELQTFTYGIDVHWRPHERVSVDAGYRRYEMEGLDGRTSPSAYPSAHTVYAGLTYWF